MNGKQAAKAAAKRIEEMEHTIAQYKQDVKDYNAVIEDMISGKSPCSWCEDVGECILASSVPLSKQFPTGFNGTPLLNMSQVPVDVISKRL